MLKNIKNRKENQGFTIIEVLIVLAIAGLIMLVVFLAVPALQRNAHNNQYKTEANNISSAVQEVLANKQGGALGTGDMPGILTAANAQTITTLTYKAAAAAYTPTSLTTAYLEANATCGIGVNTVVTGTAGGSITPGAGTTSRSLALLYSIEGTGSTYIAQCIQVQ